MAPVEHAESHPEEVSSISASTSSVSSSPSSIDGRQEEAPVCTDFVHECQQAAKAQQERASFVHRGGSHHRNFRNGNELPLLTAANSVNILVRLKADRTPGEARVVEGSIQIVEKDYVAVNCGRYGYGKVDHSAILGHWVIGTTQEHLESLKAGCIRSRTLDDLPLMTDWYEGSLLAEPANTSSSNSQPSSSPSWNHPQRSSRFHHQHGNRARQGQGRPEQPVQQPPQYQHGPHFHMPNPELNHFQGFVLPAGFQPNTGPVSTTVNYIVVPFPSTLPSGFPGQNGMCPNPNAGYYVYYQPVVHQTAGY